MLYMILMLYIKTKNNPTEHVTFFDDFYSKYEAKLQQKK